MSKEQQKIKFFSSDLGSYRIERSYWHEKLNQRVWVPIEPEQVLDLLDQARVMADYLNRFLIDPLPEPARYEDVLPILTKWDRLLQETEKW